LFESGHQAIKNPKDICVLRVAVGVWSEGQSVRFGKLLIASSPFELGRRGGFGGER
jgi:hypothetical protein